MKRMRVAVATLLMALLCGSVTAAAYDYPGTVRPGDTVGIDSTEFYDARGNYLVGDVEFTSSNFEISKRTIKTGANLIEEIKINNRAKEVQIVFADVKMTAAPKRPNVVISDLSVRARRTLRDSGGDIAISSGTVYKADVPINFYVGLDTESWTIDRDGSSLTLNNGDKQYIDWGGDSSGVVSVSYGDVAYTEGRVYSGDKLLYYFSSDVDERLEDANPSAFISACDMGTATFPSPTKIQLLANKGDYVYEYNNGKLSAATGLKWSEEEFAWTGKINKAKYYVFSDVKLRSISGALVGGATGSTGSSNSDDSDDDSELTPDDPRYYNPETGSGSNLAVALSAIVAILAVAVVSIIMSTIVTVKKKQ